MLLRSIDPPSGAVGMGKSQATRAPVITLSDTFWKTTSKLVYWQMGKRSPPVRMDSRWCSGELLTESPPLPVHLAVTSGAVGGQGAVTGLFSPTPLMLWKT